MKKRLLYSVYALELEMKMLKLGADDKPVLKGEVPVHFLSYIMSALGCFLSEKELEMMHKDVNFENKYLHNGQKTTLNVLDIMKLYVNYRPQEPLTKEKVSQAFKDVVALEPDPDKVTRARFLDIITTRGDAMSQDEFLTILKCLKGVKSDQLHSERTYHLNTNRITDANQIFLQEEKVDQTISEEDEETKSVLENLVPDVITEEVFMNDILCLGTSKEDLLKYILTKEDHKLVPDPPTFNDFLNVVKEYMSL
ncbi:uncharacterized protein LOC118203225 [Stegodyphus dumicola]|uniref:uncharacterized protein LOC118203225 n=1 Tax=Stegodyphus dumicola TaxID=202533 RepID=UPI0015B0FDF7|nr:uncharacterized protein LOC118203225 [Stegodyphus dumicola]